MRAILKQLRSKHTAKMRVVEIGFGLVLCILASIAMTSLVSRVSETIAIPYVSSSDKHKVAVKSAPTSDAGKANQSSDNTSNSTVPVSAASSTGSSAPAHASKGLATASVSTPVLKIDPIQVANPLPKDSVLCKIPVSVTIPALSLHTCE